MKNKKISMQVIADKLGITKVSVSKVLNNQPGVGDELRRKVIETAQELGYLNDKKSTADRLNRFAFIVPKRFFLENENFYTTIYYYLNKECLANKIDLSLFVINLSEEKKLLIPPSLNKDNYDGVFLGGEIDEAYLFALANLNIPTVSIDFYKPNMNIDCILTDNFYISYSATTYLLENGHRKVGFVGDPRQTSSIMDRFFGFQKALAQYNLPYSDAWNIVNNDPATGLYYLDFELPSDLPSAFICHCDMAAYFLMQKLQSKGFIIPEDISIVSFDNTEMSKICNPPLTTIEINKKEFAIKAFQQMLERIEHKDLPPQRIYIHTEMIKRNSVKTLTSTSNAS